MISVDTSQAIRALVSAEATVEELRDKVRVSVFNDLAEGRITEDEAATIYAANGIRPAPILPAKDEPHA